jgi:hypothetical protein
MKANPQYCKEIDLLFKNLKWKVTKSDRKGKRKGQLTWALLVENSKKINLDEKTHKIIPLWMLHQLSLRQLNVLFYELMKGDGSKKNWVYYAKSNLARDRFQYLCSIIGRASINSKNSVHCCNEKFTSLQSSKKNQRKIKYSGIIWCPTVANGFVLMRRDGKAFISGNSAYPSIIKDLCLDPQNITTKNENSLSINITDRETQEFIESINITQNKDAILPSVIDQLLVTKTKFGKLKKTTPTNDPNYENICLSYDAVKAIVNTAYGCFGNRFFRLFSRKIVSLITSTARDLLHYLKDKLNELGYKVIYVDTDGCIVNDNGKNLSDLINKLIQDWSKERFNKPSSITIERKGIFKKLFVLTMCRYKGWIETSSGLKEEIKGAQIKKKDSTIFISTFQDTLIEKIFAKETEQGLVDFIANEIERIKTLPLEEIAFPNSIGKKIDEYKTEVTNKLGKTYSKKPPVFVQAYQNAQKLNNGFNKALGESFLWVYCLNENKEIYPLAFDENTIKSIKDIAWSKMIERNIHNIAKAVFDSKGWNYVFIAPKVKRVKKTPKNAPNLGVEGSNLNDCKESGELPIIPQKEIKKRK